MNRNLARNENLVVDVKPLETDSSCNILMKGPIHINSKKGIEIFNYLKEALNLPDNLVECSVSFKLNDVFVVDCKYYPRAKHD
jgi:hypothetical protein